MDFYKGKKVLVTGAYGFVGTHLCRALKNSGAIIFRFGRQHDVRDAECVLHMIKEFNPAVVFHLAAQTEVGASFKDPMETLYTNVGGTASVLDAVRQVQGDMSNLPHLVIASTDKVYGNQKGICTEETPLLKNADVYSASKSTADELAQLYQRLYNVSSTIIRPCNIYGPGQYNQTTLITGAVCNILTGNPVVVHKASHDITREWLYVHDAVKAYMLAGTQTGTAIYNVGTASRWSVRFVADMIVKLIGKGSVEVKADGTPPYQIGDQGIDSTKFCKAFPEWEARDLSRGLSATIEWYTENL